MRRISWIVILPLMIVVLFLAIANRDRVAVDLWPLAKQIDPPLSILVLAVLFVGFLLGALVTWVSASRGRRRAREEKFRTSHLQREVVRLQREVDRAKGQAAPGAGEADRARASLPAISSGG